MEFTVKELVDVFNRGSYDVRLKATTRLNTKVNRNTKLEDHTSSVVCTNLLVNLGDTAFENWDREFLDLVANPESHNQNVLIVEGHLVKQRTNMPTLFSKIWNPDAGYEPVISFTGLPFAYARDLNYSIGTRKGFGSAYFAINFGFKKEDWVRAMEILKDNPNLANDVLLRREAFKTRLGTEFNFYENYILNGSANLSLDEVMQRANGTSIKEAGLPSFEVDLYFKSKDSRRVQIASTRD